MDIRQLRAFTRVYERKSFSKAAEDLYLSQPTVSAHIASLENRLKVTLFDRLGRGILSTAAADILYAHCRDIFASIEQSESEIRLLSNEISGTLLIGGSTIPANYFLPEWVSRFLGSHPDVAFSLEQGTTSDIIHGVLSGRLHLGVVGACEESQELKFSPLFDDALVVLAAPCFATKAEKIFSLDEICRMPWILRHPGSGTRLAMERALESAGCNLRCLHVKSVVDSTEALLRFVRCGLGVTVSSMLAARESLQRSELVVLNVPDLHFQRSFFVVHHRQRHQFPATRFFLEFLLNNAQTLVSAGDYKLHNRCITKVD